MIKFKEYVVSAFLILILTKTTVATIIGTYAEAQCQGSLQLIDGPNGVNGTCSELRSQGDFQSFRVLEKDPGCAVTVYQYREEADTSCSSPVLEVIPPTNPCYDDKWFYYSIDNCEGDNSTPTPNAIATTTPTSTPGSIPNSTVLDTDRSPSPTATGSLPPTSDKANNNAPRDHYSPNKPIIVGSIVGSFVGLTLLSILLFWLHARRRARSVATFQRHQTFPPREMTGVPTREMGATPSLKSKIASTSELHSTPRYQIYAGASKSRPSTSSGTKNIAEPISEVISMYAGLAAHPYPRTETAPYASTIYTEIVTDDGASTHGRGSLNPIQRTSSRSSRTTCGSVYSERSLPPLPPPLRPHSVLPSPDVRSYPIARAKRSKTFLYP